MRYHISQKVLVDTYERKAAATITDAAIRQAIPAMPKLNVVWKQVSRRAGCLAAWATVQCGISSVVWERISRGAAGAAWNAMACECECHAAEEPTIATTRQPT